MNKNEIKKIIWCAIAWSIWGHRNSCVFRGTSFDESNLLDDSMFLAERKIKRFCLFIHTLAGKI